MFDKVIDALMAIVFFSGVYFGSTGIYKFLKDEAIPAIHHGPSSVYSFTKSLTKKRFDWEK